MVPQKTKNSYIKSSLFHTPFAQVYLMEIYHPYQEKKTLIPQYTHCKKRYFKKQNLKVLYKYVIVES